MRQKLSRFSFQDENAGKSESDKFPRTTNYMRQKLSRFSFQDENGKKSNPDRTSKSSSILTQNARDREIIRDRQKQESVAFATMHWPVNAILKQKCDRKHLPHIALTQKYLASCVLVLRFLCNTKTALECNCSQKYVNYEFTPREGVYKWEVDE